MKRGLDIITLPFKVLFYMVYFIFKLAMNFMDAIIGTQT